MNSRGAVRHLELFVLLRISASPSGWEPWAETKWRALGEFLRGGTDGSNPSLSTGKSGEPDHVRRPRSVRQSLVQIGENRYSYGVAVRKSRTRPATAAGCSR